MSEITKIIKVESRRDYDVWQVSTPSGMPNEVPMLGIMAYAKDGSCIGTKQDAEHWAREGVVPQRAAKDARNAGLGWQEAEQKWWGWSHRAKYGFGIGDKVVEGDVLEGSDEFPVGFIAATLDDAKAMAIRFAIAVG